MDSNSCPSNRLYHAKMLDMLVVFFRVKQIEREQEEDDESRMKSKILHVFDDDDSCGVERMVICCCCGDECVFDRCCICFSRQILICHVYLFSDMYFDDGSKGDIVLQLRLTTFPAKSTCVPLLTSMQWTDEIDDFV